MDKSPRKSTRNSLQLPILNSNLLKSLNSVHLPPPPASSRTANAFNATGSATKMGNHRSPPFVHPGKQQFCMTGESNHSVKLNTSSSPLVPNRMGVMLNTPPPSQTRQSKPYYQAVNTPTLGGRARAGSGNKENSFLFMPSPTGPSPVDKSMHESILHREMAAPRVLYNLTQLPTDDGCAQNLAAHTDLSRPQVTQHVQEIIEEEEEEEFVLPEPHEMPSIVDDGTKPPYSYATLIAMAILRSPNRRLTLSQIYQWINDSFEWYRNSKSGWQNSIRHNLSLNKAFTKEERPKDDPGKGHYWLVVPGKEAQFLKGRCNRRNGSSSVQMVGTRHHKFFSTTSLTETTSSPFSAPSKQHLHQFSSSQPEPVHSDPTTDHAPSSADNELPQEDEDYSETDSQETSTERRSSDNISVHEDDHDPAAADSSNFCLFDPETAITPMKRSNTAIGLQHFSRTNVTADSPIKKRNAPDDHLPFIEDSPSAGSSIKRPRLIKKGHSMLDHGSLPLLNVPSASWMPVSHDDDTGMTTMLSLPSPSIGSASAALLLGGGPSKSNHFLVPNFQNKVFSPNTSLRNHCVLVRSLTTPSHEFEDLLSSPSAGALKYSCAEADDDISRACFGSPAKRAAKRQQYFEHSGVADFDEASSVADVFGVDICQVVRRAVESKPGSDDQPSCDALDRGEDDCGKYLSFDSPIKTADNFSPAKFRSNE